MGVTSLNVDQPVDSAAPSKLSTLPSADVSTRVPAPSHTLGPDDEPAAPVLPATPVPLPAAPVLPAVPVPLPAVPVPLPAAPVLLPAVPVVPAAPGVPELPAVPVGELDPVEHPEAAAANIARSDEMHVQFLRVKFRILAPSVNAGVERTCRMVCRRPSGDPCEDARQI